MRTSALFALACICAIQFSAFSDEVMSVLPQITTEKIHGFDVEFVNIGKGDTLGVSFFTDYGSLDDQGQMMGRAHLLEHLFFTGNVRFPGYNTYKKMSQPAGARFNAHTGLERTYYYLSGAQEKAELLLSLELSMLGGLEWNPEYFRKERAVVINEIVQEKMTKDDSAFFMMGFLHLLPQNHPWAQHGYVGDGGNLPFMEIVDVKQLYENQYRPGRVKVVIHGNFSDPSFLDQIRQWTAKYLPSDRVLAPLALRPATPSLVSNDGEQAQQRLFVQTRNFTKGMVLIESDPQIQLPTMAVFSLLETYLSLEATGSLIHELKSVRGLVNEASFSSFRLQDKTYLMFDYTPTEKGLGQESVIEGMAFEHLRSISLNGVPQDTLTLIKKARLDQLKKSAASVEKFMQSYEEILIDQQPMSQTVAEVQQADGQTLAQIARAFRPERALYSTMTTKSEGMKTDARFNRGFKKVNNQNNLATLRKIMSKPVEQHYAPRLVPVLLGQPNSQVENRFIHSRREAMQPLQMVLDMRNDLPDTAAAVRLKTADSSPEALVAAELMFEAFKEVHAGELEYLKLRHNIEITFTREAGEIRLAAYGENSLSAPALSWAIARLGELSLTPELFESLRMRYIQTHMENYVRDFTALITYQEVASQLDLLRPNRIQRTELAKRLSLTQAEQLWKGLRSASNKEVLMVGAFNEGDADGLVRELKKLSPLYLSAAQAESLNPRRIEPFSKLPLVLRQDGARSGQGVGIIRVYHGPSVLDFAESAAFETLASVVGVQVSMFNRSHQQLGYIHQAVARTFDQRNLELIIVGQTEGEENTRKTINGWHHVLELLASGQITDEDIEASRQDVLNQLTQKRNSAKEILTETYESGLTQRFDALAAERLIEALKALTSADVRASANKYLLGSGIAYHQLTLNPCQSLLE